MLPLTLAWALFVGELHPFEGLSAPAFTQLIELDSYSKAMLFGMLFFCFAYNLDVQ